MTTAVDLITLALKNAGVLGMGQTPNAEDTNDAFSALQFMLNAWKRERPNAYHLSDVSFVSTGAASYTIGSGGTINVARPNAIESAFVRQITGSPNPVDTPLQVVEAREDYNRIASKSVTSYPSVVFLDTDYPLANLYVWPIPTATIYEIHLSVKGDLSVPAALTDELAFPPEYMEAILYNLGARLRPMYQLPPDPQLNMLAKVSLSNVQRANAQIPRLQIPRQIMGRGQRYNIYSDT